MNLGVSVNQKQLMDVLLNVGTIRPVFIWGAPGIGKSAIVEQFAEAVGLPFWAANWPPKTSSVFPRSWRGAAYFARLG